MSTGKHYFIEQNDNGKYAVRAKGSDHASGLFDTQAEAVAHAREINPDDHPDVERPPRPHRRPRQVAQSLTQAVRAHPA